MPGNLSFTLVFIIFIASTAVVIVTGLFVISLVLRAQHKYRKRLARVGRKRLSGRLDLDDARLILVRQKQDSNAFAGLLDAVARFVPLLNTTRLRANIRRAGLSLSIGAFIAISLVLAVPITFVLHFFSGFPYPLLVAPAILAGMIVVDGVVKLRGGMLANKFMKQLPEGIDTIIRGIRSGLPVIECVGTVGEEYDDPMGGHFQAISERVMLGEPIDAALWRVARVIDRPEMDFLSISIAIQMETGGSLSEALGNLADLLRKRQQMKLKIKAISSEAKASAMIIGALPFLMLILLMVMSPDYIMPLFSDPRGQIMLGAGLASIMTGAFVMWRMTQFENVRLGDPTVMQPVVLFAVSGTLVLLLSASAFGLWVYDRRERMQRVRTAVGRRVARGGGAAGLKKAKNTALQKGALDFMRASTKRVSIMKDRQSRDTGMALVGAGFRSRDAIVVFTFFKMVTPVVFLIGAAICIYGLNPIDRGPWADLGGVVGAALLGSKLPDLIVKNRRKKRLESMRKSLPDALDMLVICAEAGLASDAALKRVVAETSRKASILGEELNQTALELSFMPERRTALENLAARAPLPSIQAFVNTLIQAEKYGTPLARAFKVLSQEQRNERMMRAEEKAGRLPATMTVPMMLFILPALFVVLIGPAILDILDNFIGMER